MIGMTIAETLALDEMAGSRLLAGAEGRERVVERLNMMEAPDVLPWVRPSELLVTSGYPLVGLSADRFAELIHHLDDRGLSGICIKLGRFLDAVPCGVLEVADKVGFPIIVMPSALSFTDLLGAVMRVLLDRLTRAVQSSDEVDRMLLTTLTEGGGIDELATRLADWLGAPIAIVDGASTTLARAGGDIGTKYGEAQFPGRDQLADIPGGAVLEVRAGGERLGLLVCDRPLTELDPIHVLALRRAAPVVALELLKRGQLRAVEEKYQGDFLRDLLDGRNRDPHLLEHCRRLGWDLERRLALLAVVPSDPRAGRAAPVIAEALRRVTERRWPGSAIHAYSSEVIALVPAEAVDSLEDIVRDAGVFIPADQRGFRVGASAPFDRVDSLPRALSEATQALDLASSPSDIPVARFDRMGLTRMVSAIAASGSAGRIVDDLLGPVLSHRRSTDLLMTLDTYLSVNGNVGETARRLKYHYNTVRLRVERLEALLGPFVDDAARRTELLTACRLHRLVSTT